MNFVKTIGVVVVGALCFAMSAGVGYGAYEAGLDKMRSIEERRRMEERWVKHKNENESD